MSQTQQTRWPVFSLGYWGLLILVVVRSWTVSSAQQVPQAVPPVDANNQTLRFGGIDFVQLPAGSFVMGSQPAEPGHKADEQPPQTITIARPFALSRDEITQRQYWSVMDSAHVVEQEQQHLPITDLTWIEADLFCQRLSEQHGRPFRLPSEAEWEYACRAGTSGPFAVGTERLPTAIEQWQQGDPQPLQQWATALFHCQGTAPREVGQYPPNAWGLRDMHGNVAEWCSASAPAPFESPTSRTSRPVRGGSYASDGCLDCRSARRTWKDQAHHSPAIGFRVFLEQ